MCKIISELYNIKVDELDSYLNVTFVSSNPILYTSRLYNLFSSYNKTIKEYDNIPLFYEERSEETSKLFNSFR